MSTFRTRVEVRITIIETGDSTGVNAPVDRVVMNYDETFENGTGDNQMNTVWSDQDTVVASTPDDLDMQGSLASGLGQAHLPVEVRLIALRNKGTSNKLLVGGDSAGSYAGLFGAVNDVLKVGESTSEIDGIFLWVAPKDGGGLGVTATTADILQIDSSTGTATYQGVIGGVLS